MNLTFKEYLENLRPIDNTYEEILGTYNNICRLGISSEEYDKICIELTELIEEKDSHIPNENNIQDLLRW